MRKILLLSFISIFTLTLSAQDGKKARKDIRSGNKAFREQLYGTAESKYADAATSDPASAIASYNLATTYYKQQRWDDALKEYQRYLSLENQNQTRMSNAWSNIGNVYLRKKGDEPSQNRAKQTAQMQSGQVPQQGGEGQGKEADNLKLSIEAYKNSLRLNPKDDDTRYNLAVAQKMLKDKEGEGGGQDNKKDQNQDKKDDQKQDQNQQNQDKKQDQKQDQQQNQNQMSQDNIQQILQALEQEEKQTQERVQKMKEQQRQRQNADNKRQNKDW